MTDAASSLHPLALSDPAPITYAGVTGGLLIGGMGVSDLVAILSAIVGLSGFLAQVYYIWLVKRSIDKNGKAPD